MFKLVIVAAFVVAVAMAAAPPRVLRQAPLAPLAPLSPINPYASPLAYGRGLNPYGAYYGGLGINGLGLGGDYYNRGAYYNRLGLGRGVYGADYYNRGLFGGDYYNNGFYNNRFAVPAVIPPVVPVRPAVIPPVVRAPVPIVRAPVPLPVVRAPITTQEGGARIVAQTNDARADGAYTFHYETENGIVANEQNVPKVAPDGEVINAVQGTYSYVAPNGEQIAVSYVADENGFQPQLHDASVTGRVAPK